MTSVSATELAKLGKCEALVTPRRASAKPAKRGSLKGVLGFKVAKRNQAEIDRGNAAHDRFEHEAKTHASKECHTRTTVAQNLVLALAVAVGLLTLMAAVAN